MDELQDNEIYEGMGLEPPATPPKGGEPGGVSDLDTGAGDNVPPATPPEGGEPGGEPTPPDAGGEGTPPAQPSQVPPGGDPQPGQVGALDQPAPAEVRGLKSPYSGKPVLTMADYQEYQRAFNADMAATQQREREAALRDAGLDPAAIAALVQEAVANDPAVQAARRQQAEAERQAAMGWYAEQIQEINALDPGANIKDLNDLAGRDGAAYQKMMAYVRRSNSLVDAYRLVHFDRLLHAQTAAAEQKALNQAAGKGHMAPLGNKGGPSADVDVPAEVMQQYREIFPNMSDADIRKEYAACLKDGAST